MLGTNCRVSSHSRKASISARAPGCWLALTSALTYNKVARTQRENLLLTFGFTVEDWF